MTADILSLPKWRQIDATTYAVHIDPKTTLGEAALMYFMRRIPINIRRNFRSLRWCGDFWEGSTRWGLIKVTL